MPAGAPPEPPASDLGAGAEPDDRELLAAHLDGDDQAFGRLFTRHRDRLWAVALRTTGDPEEAADALQDALISAFRRASTYRGDAAVTTWLHRIVVNACLDRLRRQAVRRTRSLPEDADPPVDRSGGSPSESHDPAVAAEREDLRRTLLAALATLPPDQRAALVLVDMEGYSVEEAARILEVAPGTVKSRCSRGRARLRDILEGSKPLGTPVGNRWDPARVPSPPDRDGAGATGGGGSGLPVSGDGTGASAGTGPSGGAGASGASGLTSVDGGEQ